MSSRSGSGTGAGPRAGCGWARPRRPRPRPGSPGSWPAWTASSPAPCWSAAGWRSCPTTRAPATCTPARWTAPTCGGTPTTTASTPATPAPTAAGSCTSARATSGCWTGWTPTTAGRLEISLGSPAAGRAPRLISARGSLGGLSCDHTGQASAVEVRGTVHWLTHRDGPGPGAVGRPRRPGPAAPGARRRPARWSGSTDAEGADALEIAPPHGPAAGDAAAAARRGRDRPGRRPGRRAGRHAPWPSPRATAGCCWSTSPPATVTELAGSDDGEVTGLAFSPDSAWLAWSHPGPRAAAPAAPGPGRRPAGRDRRHRRPVHRHRARVHRRRPVPGVPVPAQLRPGLRRARLRPVASLRLPALPAAAGRGHAVAVRPAAGGRPVGSRPRTTTARPTAGQDGGDGQQAARRRDRRQPRPRSHGRRPGRRPPRQPVAGRPRRAWPAGSCRSRWPSPATPRCARSRAGWSGSGSR